MVRFQQEQQGTGLKKLSFMLIVASLLAVAMSAGAQRLEHLFEVSVAATGRDRQAREAALGRAMENLLVRLTGSRAVLSDAAGAELRKNPGRFVEQYRFIEPPAGQRRAGLRLWVQFDGVSLERELRAAGLPYWGAQRPDVLLWLAVDDRGQRYLAAENGARPANAVVQQAAQRFGVPLRLPLIDLEDQREVDFTDVWGGFLSRIETASQRYRPQAILTGRLQRRSAGGWRADWQLLDGAERQAWSTHGDEFAGALQAGIGASAEWLAQRYAVVASAAATRSLVVEGVQDLENYARVSDYLGALSPVDRVNVVRVRQGTVEFNLLLSADERSLRQLLALGRVLRQVDDPALWHFRLQP